MRYKLQEMAETWDVYNEKTQKNVPLTFIIKFIYFCTPKKMGCVIHMQLTKTN